MRHDPLKVLFSRTFILFFFLGTWGEALVLPGNLGQSNVNRIVQIVEQGSLLRLYRSAESYVAFPGIKFGVTSGMLLTQNISNLGNQVSDIPSALVLPGLYVAKGLGQQLEVGLQYWPSGALLDWGNIGGNLKWTWMDERYSLVSGAFFGAASHCTAFRNAYSGNSLELGVVFSKDFVQIRPYGGMGALFSEGTLSPALVASPAVQNTGYSNGLHAFVGIETELTLDLAFQFDWLGAGPAFGMLLGKHF